MMQPQPQQQTQPQQLLSKGALVLLFIVAGIGFIDAAYLSVEHYVNAVPPCSIGSCETVLTSQYASVLGVPISLFGALFYLGVLVLLKLYVDSKKITYVTIAATLSMIGALVSIILIGIMTFVIHAYCIYCLTSDILTIALCGTFWVILKKVRYPVTTA